MNNTLRPCPGFFNRDLEGAEATQRWLSLAALARRARRIATPLLSGGGSAHLTPGAEHAALRLIDACARVEILAASGVVS